MGLGTNGEAHLALVIVELDGTNCAHIARVDGRQGTCRFDIGHNGVGCGDGRLAREIADGHTYFWGDGERSGFLLGVQWGSGNQGCSHQ